MKRLIAGTFATVFTVSMQIPQIYHSIKTKRTKDISLLFLFLSILQHLAWIIYAYFDNINLPLIICDSICILLTIYLIALKYYYDNDNDEE
jgi:uncharacterized protein with PQ loop repeat